MARSTFYLSLLICPLIALGCAKSENKAVEQKYGQDHSCDFAFTEGNSAHFDQIAFSQLTAGPFGKLYNRAHIENIGTASASSTVEYLQKLGVGAFKSRDPQVFKCAIFSSLPLAPSDVQSLWASATRDVPPDRFVTGIYIPIGTSGLTSTQQMPVVSLRVDANRWTLIHEMIHHLFEVEYSNTHTIDGKPATGPALQVARESQDQRVLQLKDAMDDDPTAFSVERYLVELIKAYDLHDQELLHYPLEEVAVEYLLSQAYQDQKVLYLPDLRKNAASYIAGSIQTADAQYAIMLQSLTVYIASNDQTIRPALLAQLKELKARFEIREKEMAGLLQKFRDTLYFHDQDLQYTFTADESGIAWCNHAYEPRQAYINLIHMQGEF